MCRSEHTLRTAHQLTALTVQRSTFSKKIKKELNSLNAKRPVRGDVVRNCCVSLVLNRVLMTMSVEGDII